jgi:hypothetical protein
VKIIATNCHNANENSHNFLLLLRFGYVVGAEAILPVCCGADTEDSQPCVPEMDV